MKRIDLALALIACSTVTAPAFAASGAMAGMGDMSTMNPSATANMHGGADKVSGFMAHGKLNSIDLARASVNITHQPIKALGWPGMTMAFAVRDKSMLSGLKAGEAVDFDLAKESSGQYVITRLRAAR